jgi:hypothetical protein
MQSNIICFVRDPIVSHKIIVLCNYRKEREKVYTRVKFTSRVEVVKVKGVKQERLRG